RKGRVVAEGNTPAPDGAAGIREDPVTGIARKDSCLVVSVAGELDLYNAHALREALLECCNEAPERLVVDLSNVKFIDSTALGVHVPQVVDHTARIAAELRRRTLEMLRPETGPGGANERLVAKDDVHLGVVEERMLVQVGRADGQPGVVDDPNLRVHVHGLSV